jgi:hypothetical protein
LDQLFYWNGQDLEAKLDLFKSHFNVARVHQGLGGDTPAKKCGGCSVAVGRATATAWSSFRRLPERLNSNSPPTGCDWHWTS